MLTIHYRNDIIHIHVTEQGNLVFHILRQFPFRTAEQDIRLDADFAQFHDRMLSRLCFQFTGGADIGYQGDVNVERIACAPVEPELADSLQKGKRLYVANSTANLDDGNIGALGVLDDLVLHLVGNVGNNLYRTSEIISPPFFVDNGKINLARGKVALFGETGIGKTLVMSQVQVCFGAVVGHEDFSVLKGRHGAGVDIDVRIQFLQRNPQPARLQQCAQ